MSPVSDVRRIVIQYSRENSLLRDINRLCVPMGDSPATELQTRIFDPFLTTKDVGKGPAWAVHPLWDHTRTMAARSWSRTHLGRRTLPHSRAWRSSLMAGTPLSHVRSCWNLLPAFILRSLCANPLSRSFQPWTCALL